jgi:hypothetical protein
MSVRVATRGNLFVILQEGLASNASCLQKCAVNFCARTRRYVPVLQRHQGVSVSGGLMRM